MLHSASRKPKIPISQVRNGLVCHPTPPPKRPPVSQILCGLIVGLNYSLAALCEDALGSPWVVAENDQPTHTQKKTRGFKSNFWCAMFLGASSCDFIIMRRSEAIRSITACDGKGDHQSLDCTWCSQKDSEVDFF